MAESFSASPPARIFVSYKHKLEPGQTIVNAVVAALERAGHTVFIDKQILPGVEWGRWIHNRIGESDYLLAFLTEASINSEMVVGEISLARDLKVLQGRPQIIPIRVAFSDPLTYPLNAIIDRIQWAWWGEEADTPRLINELLMAVTQGTLPDSPPQIEAVPSSELPMPTPAAQPLRLDSPEGTIDPQSEFYVIRNSDYVALTAIQRQGATITIKGPRQMGKSSLLIRTLEAAVKASKRPVFLDYQLIERATLTDADSFYRHFCNWVTEELELENRVDEYWNSPLGNSQRCTRYFSRYLLKELQQPLVLAMDEVENLFDTSFRSDFFSMLRSWHNSRANIATPIWKQLDLLLVTSTEPYQLIENLNQSPFNVGEVINLEDFTPAQVADLNQRHNKPLNHAEEQRLVSLLCGQPYLTRRALYLITTGRLSVAELFATAADERGPFGDHLRYHLFRVHNKEELVRGLCDALLRHTCADEHLFFRLRGAGLVKRVDKTVQPRCQLYADFFREHLKCQ